MRRNSRPAGSDRPATRRMLPRVAGGAQLASTMMSASLVQFAVGALAPLILLDLELSRAALGVLLSGYYLIAALTSPGFGGIAGRMGGRRGLKLVACLAIAANLVIAGAQNAVLLGAGLLLAGLSVAVANPATNLAIAQLPPPHGMLIGVKQSGFQLAAVVAGSLLPLIAHHHGWRTSFVAASIVAAAVLVSIVAWAPASVGRTAGNTKADGVPPGVAALSAYAFFMGAGIANVNVYLVLFAHERLLFSPQTAGTLVAVIGVSAVLARIGWSIVVERVGGRLSSQRAVLIIIALIAVGAAGVTVLSEHLSRPLVWFATLGMGISAAAWNGVVMLGLVRDHQGPERLGRASGRVQGAFFVGLAVGPPVFGVAVDSTGGNYTVGWVWTALAFTAALITVLRMPGTPARAALAARGASVAR